MDQGQVLRVLHAQGLHEPGLLLPLTRTLDWLCVLKVYHHHHQEHKLLDTPKVHKGRFFVSL